MKRQWWKNGLMMMAMLLSVGSNAHGVERKGMTWGVSVYDSAQDVSRLHCCGEPMLEGNACGNAYQGDTLCSEARPVVCLKVDGASRPPYEVLNNCPSCAMNKEYYQGWAEGTARLTEPIQGNTFATLSDVNAYCEAQFGPGYRVAEHHDGRWVSGMSQSSFYGSTWPLTTSSGGWGLYVPGKIPSRSRFWAHINGQNANCWDGFTVQKGSVGDHVWADPDNDGNSTLDGDDYPLSGIKVMLRDAAGDVVRETTTYANGKYLFSHLEYGTYSVEVDQNSLPSNMRGNVAYDSDGGDDGLSAVTIGSSNPNNKTQDFAFYESAVTETAISSCQELQDINSNLSGNYYLANDIDCAGFDFGDGKGFIPIGNATAAFTGNFDGKGFTISNVSINRPEMDYVGVFGRAGSIDGSAKAAISHVTAFDFNITGNIIVGGLFGHVGYATIEDVHSVGVVDGIKWVGGLGGGALNSTITHATSSGSVYGDRGSPSQIFYGGLLGSNNASQISCSSSNADVVGNYKVGGLVGSIFRGSVSNSFATGTVKGFYRVGGLVGDNISGTISDTFASGTVIGFPNSHELAGLVGLQYQDGGNPIIKNSYATGSVTGGISNMKGILGLRQHGTCSGTYWDVTTSGVSTDACGSTGLTTALMQTQSTYVGWDFDQTWTMNGYPLLQCGAVSNPDSDQDGILDDVDNCPLAANADQADFDNDGLGNACDDDDDGDNVADTNDNCPSTAFGDVVDATGCSISQLVPCQGPKGTTASWKNKGQYVSTVAKSAENFLAAGLITQAEKDVIVSAAAQSTCGGKK